MGVRLSDKDWLVLTAHHLGGVHRMYRDTPSGVMIEYFMMGDEDVTQSVTRLERAGKLGEGGKQRVPLHLDKAAIKAAVRRAVKGTRP